MTKHYYYLNINTLSLSNSLSIFVKNVKRDKKQTKNDTTDTAGYEKNIKKQDKVKHSHYQAVTKNTQLYKLWADVI